MSRKPKSQPDSGSVVEQESVLPIEAADALAAHPAPVAEVAKPVKALPKLHALVAKAATDALNAGDHVAHAGLYSLEAKLGEVRAIAANLSASLPDHADLLDIIKATV